MMVASRVGGIRCTCYWLYLAPVWERFVVASLGRGWVAGTSYKRERPNVTRAIFLTTTVPENISSWENVGRLSLPSNQTRAIMHVTARLLQNEHQCVATISYSCVF